MSLCIGIGTRTRYWDRISNSNLTRRVCVRLVFAPVLMKFIRHSFHTVRTDQRYTITWISSRHERIILKKNGRKSYACALCNRIDDGGENRERQRPRGERKSSLFDAIVNWMRNDRSLDGNGEWRYCFVIVKNTHIADPGHKLQFAKRHIQSSSHMANGHIDA